MGLDQMMSDEPARNFGKDLTDEERKEIFSKTYERLKSSINNIIKPDGQKSSPAKTCGHLFENYPDKLSGNYFFSSFQA